MSDGSFATDAIDYRLFRDRELVTAGAAALHVLDPAEICMRMEDAENDPDEELRGDRMHLRQEIFSGFMEYLFADGPAPEMVRARIEGVLQDFGEFPECVPGETIWVGEKTVRTVLKRYRKPLAELRNGVTGNGSLCAWWAVLKREKDVECVEATMNELAGLLLTEGRTWRLMTATAYCLAKMMRPEIIAGMSLEDIALLSGDEGGRATPCNRIQRIYNRRVAAAGMKGSQVHFQKSAEAVEHYREAQRGNHNRTKHKRHKLAARRYNKKARKGKTV